MKPATLSRGRHGALLLFVALAFAACGTQEPPSTVDRLSSWAQVFEAAAPTGPYLGQTPPGDTAEIFAPGLINTGLYNRDLAMSPDGSEIYFGVLLGRFNVIMETHQNADGKWSVPDVASFSMDPRFFYLEPAMSPDGNRLMFLSTRTEGREPTPEELGSWENSNIWVVDRLPDGSWSEAYSLGAPVNTDASEFFPSLTRDGTLYFTRGASDGSESLIYRSRLVDGVYQEPERLGPEVNSTSRQYNAFIDPDERYLILCTGDREDSVGGDDYYVVFRNPDDTWVGPINLGEAVNTPRAGEISPYVSPDGRYLFFMSNRPVPDEALPQELDREFLWQYRSSPRSGNPDIYWIDAGFLEELKEEVGASE